MSSVHQVFLAVIRRFLKANFKKSIVLSYDKTTNPVKPDWWFFFYCFIPYSQEHPHLLYGPKTFVPIFETSKGSPAALAAGAPFYFAFYTIIARPLGALWCASFLQSHYLLHYKTLILKHHLIWPVCLYLSLTDLPVLPDVCLPSTASHLSKVML